MRTAITVAETHDGKEILVHGRKVPVVQQLAQFRALKTLRSHPDWKSVQFQERDGHALSITFTSPAQLEEHDARREAERKANQEFLASTKQAKTDGISKDAEHRAKKSAEIVKAHSAQIDRIRKEYAGGQTVAEPVAKNAVSAIAESEGRMSSQPAPSVTSAPVAESATTNPPADDARKKRGQAK